MHPGKKFFSNVFSPTNDITTLPGEVVVFIVSDTIYPNQMEV